MANRVFVEIDPTSRQVLRIIKAKGGALMLPPERVMELPRVEAVSAIRKELVRIANGECPYCGGPVGKGHMHERLHRSKGGEISLSNSVIICPNCHVGKKGEHSARAPQWSKS